ncbi:KH domain-containing protein [Terriglobus albidus]|uniref:KH domain-containing protein n=1 Tax=Terriglobus albidus TaxID=1592106 RepID=UPI0021DF4E18|nr:KH domain-containing protein [Terriglobus albidus]
MTTISRPMRKDEQSIPQLVHEIVGHLVDDEAAIRVECLDGNEGVTMLNVHVASSDTGKLIGKQGRTARSLRTILSAVSMKLHHRYALHIEEDES